MRATTVGKSNQTYRVKLALSKRGRTLTCNRGDGKAILVLLFRILRHDDIRQGVLVLSATMTIARTFSLRSARSRNVAYLTPILSVTGIGNDRQVLRSNLRGNWECAHFSDRRGIRVVSPRICHG